MINRKTLMLLSLVAIAAMLLSACAPAAATRTPAAQAPTQAAVPTTAPSAGTGTKVRVATDATWPPFEVVDETSKEIVGFDIDLMKAIAQKGGFEVEFINVGFDPLLAGMANCQYDASISAITITDERKQQMGFSDPYFDAGQIISVRTEENTINAPADLTGKKVGAQIGTTGAIQAGKIQGVETKSYNSIDLAFQDLMNGQIDAVIADNPLALGYVGKNSTKLKTVGSVFTDEHYGIAVCNKNTDLLAKINAGLAAVKADGTVDQLTAKWVKSQP